LGCQLGRDTDQHDDDHDHDPPRWRFVDDDDGAPHHHHDVDDLDINDLDINDCGTRRSSGADEWWQ
jgi:hypothetical protein